jgi:hypothetical protein
MDIDKIQATVTLSKDEMWILAFAIRHDLQKSVDTHFNQLQQDADGERAFFDQKQKDIALLKKLSGVIDLEFEYWMQAIKDSFTNKRKERAKDGGK